MRPPRAGNSARSASRCYFPTTPDRGITQPIRPPAFPRTQQLSLVLPCCWDRGALALTNKHECCSISIVTRRRRKRERLCGRAAALPPTESQQNDLQRNTPVTCFGDWHHRLAGALSPVSVIPDLNL